jgi:hypothetical protein
MRSASSSISPAIFLPVASRGCETGWPEPDGGPLLDDTNKTQGVAAVDEGIV